MSTEQPKAPATQEHPFPPIAPYPPHYNGGTYPPPGFPPYYAYPPPPPPEGGDSNNPPGGPPGPFIMSFPPPPHGMVYAYPHPPPGQGFTGYSSNPSAASTTLRPKRRQVKMACTHCAAACKRCDEARPCERCIKYSLTETCVDGHRKERKKGIKRGPYKRKNKSNDSNGDYQNPNGEWQQSSSPQPTTSPATTSAAIHAVAQFAPEGYYPYYYPAPGFPPPVHDGHSGPEGGPPPNGNGQPQPIPYFIHPGGYPPFSHFPHPGPGYPPHGGPPPPPHTLDPVEASKKPEENNSAGTEGGVAGKKRSKKSGEAKAKKAKKGSSPKIVPQTKVTTNVEVEDVDEDSADPESPLHT